MDDGKLIRELNYSSSSLWNLAIAEGRRKKEEVIIGRGKVRPQAPYGSAIGMTDKIVPNCGKIVLVKFRSI
ncbi:MULTISPECIES: hypothetical protein [unclassified Microcoleus]|uniref:hypothetical protein n=1 Tax=unclassified Microcoleus TaxID=2642155 RepID=UPI002FD1ABF7